MAMSHRLKATFTRPLTIRESLLSSIPQERRFWKALAVSATVHTTIAMLLALIIVESHRLLQPGIALQSVLPDSAVDSLVDGNADGADQGAEMQSRASLSLDVVPEAGLSAPLGGGGAPETPRPLAQGGATASATAFSAFALTSTVAGSHIGEAGYGERAGLAGEDAEGEGEESGTGDGAFFGVKTGSKRIIYIVDNSLSMSTPHNGGYGTRFLRVQAELFESIGRLRPSQKFFIIYFGGDTIPMPAKEMVAATRVERQKWVEWASQAQANSHGTDPRMAVTIAQKLRPTEIYLLSDGEFHPAITRDLLALSQKSCRIHTIAFGTEMGELSLKAIAERHRGTYSFVP